VAKIASAVRRLRRDEPVELGDWLAPNFFHLFSEEEIRAELRDAGFRVDHYAGQPYGHALARRIAVGP
jgi:hypothetical protein